MAEADNEFPTIIGPDAVFKGELRFEKGVKHLGKFEGQIESDGQLLVAEGATLIGEVKAGTIQVDGEVKGNLHASGKVRLTATARLEGDLYTARLEVADGAVFIGRCVVGKTGDGSAKGAAVKPVETKAAPDAVKPKPQELAGAKR